MIRGMVMVCSHGRMVANTKVCGKMANNMEKENISILMIMLEQAIGKKEKELSGLVDKKYSYVIM